MSCFSFVVNANDEIERLDLFLSKKFPELSRSRVVKFISDSKILVNNLRTNKKYLPRPGDTIFVDSSDDFDPNSLPKAQNIPLNIVYEDDFLMVVNKAKGMVTHPAPGNYENTLVNALLYYTKKLSNFNSNFRPGIVHRLDKETSGLMLVAKNNFVHEKLANQIKFHLVKREYVGIVHGILNKNYDKINSPIGRDKKNRKKMCVTFKNSKNAITNYEVVKTFQKFSYLKFNLETGRTHQIRVHMSHIGHPLLGDLTYGGKNIFDFLKGQCLHSISIEFEHPIYKKTMKFKSSLPDYFQKILNIIS